MPEGMPPFDLPARREMTSRNYENGGNGMADKVKDAFGAHA